MGDNTIYGDSLSTRSSEQWQILNYSGVNSVLTAPADKPKSKLQS